MEEMRLRMIGEAVWASDREGVTSPPPFEISRPPRPHPRPPGVSELSCMLFTRGKSRCQARLIWKLKGWPLHCPGFPFLCGNAFLYGARLPAATSSLPPCQPQV